MSIRNIPTLPMLVEEVMQPTALSIGAGESLPAAVRSMQALGVRRLLVLEDGRLMGLLTAGAVDRALPKLADARTPWEYILQADRLRVIMRRDLCITRPGDPVHQAIRTLLKHKVGGLPVVNAHDVLVGLLTVTDVMRAALATPQFDLGTVGEHLSGGTVTVSPETTLAEAEARMMATRLRILPVTHGRTLLGALHQQDIWDAMKYRQVEHKTVLEAVFTDNHAPFRYKTVLDLKCLPGVVVQADTPLPEAVLAMLNADVYGLAVTGSDPREFLGVITMSDILRALLTKVRGTIPPLNSAPPGNGPTVALHPRFSEYSRSGGAI